MDVCLRSAPVTVIVVFVIVIGFDFLQGLIDDLLGRVFDVVSTSCDWIFNVVPVLSFPIEAVDFIPDSSSFEGRLEQVGRLTLSNSKTERQIVGEFCLLHTFTIAMSNYKTTY